MEWQQIETAPKDGTWILAINSDSNGGRPHVVHFSEKHGKKFPWTTGAGAVARMTHWMPLPEPPEL